MPDWLYRSDKTDRIFCDELLRTIKESGRYKVKRINVPQLLLFSETDAKRFCERNDLALIILHDSPFYHSSKRYSRNVRLLEKYVPFMNNAKAHGIGHNKISTKRLLREKGISVLDDVVVSSAEELLPHLEEGKWYVVKPADEGAGTGVKLIKKEAGNLLEYHDGDWKSIKVSSKRTASGTIGIKLWRGTGLRSYSFYSPMLVEPYFNDDTEGFSSLRCTVVGNEVVEAVKRTNKLNITSNISGGGTAQNVSLSNEQKEMAVAVCKAVGADYAGVDFLVSGGKTVVGEINIGPFTVFSRYTDAPVGKTLAEYAMRVASLKERVM